MKIAIKEDGQLIVDGENNTTINVKSRNPILEDGKVNPDFISFEGLENHKLKLGEASVTGFTFSNIEGEFNDLTLFIKSNGIVFSNEKYNELMNLLYNFRKNFGYDFSMDISGFVTDDKTYNKLKS